jgi:glycosyltransferase involved in cell wall biosynthesis
MRWLCHQTADEPLISVLLAVYNGERYLRDSIQSVVAQSYQNLELLIGFNGTVDTSRDIAGSFHDQRIRIFDYGEDKGKAKTLNKLLTHAQGTWVCIQDDDDIWVKTKLREQIRFAEKADVIGSFVEYIDENGEIIGKPSLAQTHRMIKKLSLGGVNQVANTSAMVRAEALRNIRGWNESLDGIEDFDLWLRLLRQGYKFRNVPLKLVKHRLHKNSHFNTQKYDLSRIL